MTSKKKPSTSSRTGSGSGTEAFAGLTYQIDVSIWLALDLMLISRRTDAVELEPASQEDLEAVLEDWQPGPVSTNLSLQEKGAAYRLIVQAKLRTGDPWSVADVKRLLQHGIERTSAADRLVDPANRYLLVTSAALSGDTKMFRTHVPAIFPKPQRLPATIADILPPDAAGRLAILSNHEADWLKVRIRDCLSDALHVPRARWECCLKALRAEARSLMERKGSKIWSRSALVAIIKAHDGYLTSSPELDDYVKPVNWIDLQTRLTERHAVFILGQSGTGKSLAVEKLFYDLKASNPELERVHVQTPAQITNHRPVGPVFYDIEDPWGRVSYDQSRRDWNDMLDRVLQTAGPDRYMVATSRLDVGEASQALDRTKAWHFSLEATDYGRPERHRLYGLRVARLEDMPRRQLALRSEGTVLAALRTPFEIQKFFDTLRVANPTDIAGHGERVISDAIAKSHQDAIEDTVRQQIADRGEIKAAAILWALLSDRRTVSWDDLQSIEEAIYDRDPDFAGGLTPLVGHFIATRNLRQKGTLISYYHPRVQAGIVRIFTSHRLVVRKALATLIEILPDITLDDGSSAVAMAAEILAFIRQSDGLSVSVSEEAEAKIDRWIAEMLSRPSDDFKRDLSLACDAGSDQSKAAKLAHWLFDRNREGDLHELMTWSLPDHPDSWYEEMRADPAIKPLIERFLIEVLPQDRDSYDLELVGGLERMAEGLTDAYIASALVAVELGVIRSDDTIFAGAFADFDACLPVLERALEVITPTPAEVSANAVEWLRVRNDEFSPAYYEHRGDDEDGYTADQFIRAYGETLRARRGWQALAQHAYADQLIDSWWRAAWDEDAPPDDDELLALESRMRGTEHEDKFWRLAEQFWSPILNDRLLRRLSEGAEPRKARIKAMSCLVENARDLFSSLVDRVTGAGDMARLADIVQELASSGGLDQNEAGVEPVSPLTLPEPYAELANVCLKLSAGDEPFTVSPTLAATLSQLTPRSEALHLLRVRLAAHGGPALDADILWLLDHSAKPEFACEAIDLAIALNRSTIVEGALNHRFSAVVAQVMVALAPPPPAPLPPFLLDVIKTTGRPARKALVALIAERPDPTHLPTLLAMAEDRLSNSDYHDHEDSYPIARAAVAALADYSLTLDQAVALRDIACTTDDPDLRSAILSLLLKGPDAYQDLVFRLAIDKGKPAVRRAADVVLLRADFTPAPSIVAQITPDLLRTQPTIIASTLVILAGLHAEDMQVRAIAEMLAGRPKRRVFIALLVFACGAMERRALAEEIAAFLPRDHAARRWALGEPVDDEPDECLSDLGDVAAVSEVLRYFRMPLRTPDTSGPAPN